MPQSSPTPAQRVAHALQRAHARAEWQRDQAAQDLRTLTERHAEAVAALHDAHAEEQALAAALHEAGGRTLQEEQAEREEAARVAHAYELAERAHRAAGPEATPAEVVAHARRLSAQDSPEAAALARTLADPTSTAATRAAAAQAAHAAEELPPAPAPVQAGTVAAVDVLAGPTGRPREV